MGMRLAAGVAAVLMTSGGCSERGPGQGPAGGFRPPPMPVETAMVEEGAISDRFEAVGTIEPEHLPRAGGQQSSAQPTRAAADIDAPGAHRQGEPRHDGDEEHKRHHAAHRKVNATGDNRERYPQRSNG